MSESELVVDADKLAVVLAERLAAIVPDGIDVRVMMCVSSVIMRWRLAGLAETSMRQG